MWIADGWKDYEVLDTSGGEKLETAGGNCGGDGLPSGKTRPAGHLEHEKRKSGLEKEKRSLSQKQQGRRRMGVFPSAGAVGDQL